MKRNAEYNAQHSHRQKNTHAHCNSKNEQIISEQRLLRYCRNLFCKDLQIGLRDRHNYADHK